ncbi:MAG: protein kinase [Thermoleophilaceae bacterium]
MLIGERYRVVERLGTGGMATVLLAEDERLGRRVALKRLHLGSGPEVGERFRREARLGASLSHPNVVGVYDVVNHEDQVVLVMEYVEGRTLAEVLAEGAARPPGGRRPSPPARRRPRPRAQAGRGAPGRKARERARAATTAPSSSPTSESRRARSSPA